MKPDPFFVEMAQLGSMPTGSRFDFNIEVGRSRLSDLGSGGATAWAAPDLTLLGTGRRPAPAFPLPLLGPWAEWVTIKAAGASAPVDYAATALLACAGAAIANVRWPQAGAAWSEPPLLWCALVGPPSSSKSPSMDAAFELVRFAEVQMAAGFEATQLAHATQMQACEARLDEWKAAVKKAVKAGVTTPEMPSDALPTTAPVRPRIRVADATVEALGGLAAALPRGLLLVRDELSGWLGAFDKYGGGGSDRAFAIEMYGGRSYVVDRVKNPLPLHIRNLSIGVLGGVQPEKLAVIIDGPDDGLASRLLWSWPETMPGFSLARALHDDTMEKQNFARLTDLAIAHDEAGQAEPVRVRLTAAAEDLLEAFARGITGRAQHASGLFAGTLGKARGHALRLSAILEYLWWCGGAKASEPSAISARAVEAAAGLLDGYFLPMAERAYGDAAIPLVERRAMLLARYLRRSGQAVFNAREARRTIGGTLREASAMQGACTDLTEAGPIRPAFERLTNLKGRPAQKYDVNPVLLEGQP